MVIGTKKRKKELALSLQKKMAKQAKQFPAKMDRDFLAETNSYIDAHFQETYAESEVGPKLGMEHHPYAIVAVGGYGRQEQNFKSDIDVLFLFEKKVPDNAKELVEELMYPLWDLGFELGYAMRTIPETIALMKEEVSVLTSVLDARFVCGASILFLEMTRLIREDFLPKYRDRLGDMIVDRNIERHLKYGDSSDMLEPNLKEGRGGLRDYHALLWIAKAKFDVITVRDLEYQGILSPSEYESQEAALTFIWEVRNRLHLLTGRKTDRLSLAYQEKIAMDMGFVAKNGQLSVEQFLGELHRHMEFFKKQYTVFLCEHGFFEKVFGQRKATRQSKVDGLVVKKGTLFFKSSEYIIQNRLLLMEIFVESAHLKVPLSAEAIRLVREFLLSSKDKFWTAPETVQAFEKVLMAPAPVFNVLGQMEMTGLLTRFIPEFSTVENRIQYNQYHIYPVDRHIIQTVRNLKRMMTEAKGAEFVDPFSVEVMKGLQHRKRLLWAALLHDIGKGFTNSSHAEAGAEIARAILEKKGLLEADIETIVFLVREHLFLAKTVARRDIEDEDVIASCATRIKTVERLRMLYLLTVADSISTGPKAWNSWTQSMLQEFFLRLHEYLESGDMPSARALDRLMRKRDEILKEATVFIPAEDAERLLEEMPTVYLLRGATGSILLHMRLYRELHEKEVAWHIEAPAIDEVRDVVVCTKDKAGLFSKLAGIFTLHGMDILAAYVMTWQNGIAIDSFQVTPPKDRHFEHEKWEKVKKDVELAVSGKLDVAQKVTALLKNEKPAQYVDAKHPNRVRVDNEASRKYSVIEVYTQDAPGLLFRLANVIFEAGLTIQLAKIATKVDQVVDVFYVRTAEGNKLSKPEEIERVSALLLDICPASENKN